MQQVLEDRKKSTVIYSIEYFPPSSVVMVGPGTCTIQSISAGADTTQSREVAESTALAQPWLSVSHVVWSNSVFIGKMVVPLGWYP